MDGIKFVKAFETTLKGDDGKSYTLIWGDRCVLRGPESNGRVPVRARAVDGTVEAAHLRDGGPLLEVYVIDVGQGDGILVHTPDDDWHLIDAGERNRKQTLNKGAPNFIRWKFRKDLDTTEVKLRNVILSHPDSDHFGGLIDVLGEEFGHPEDEPPQTVAVERFYHSGLAKFDTEDKAKQVGRQEPAKVKDLPPNDQGVKADGKFVTELLEGNEDFVRGPGQLPFAKEYGELAGLITQLPQVSRLDHTTKFLEGYGEDADVTIRVLGPVIEEFEAETDDGKKKGARVFRSNPGVTVNGHSVVLRLEFGAARILLGGDLNQPSQRLLLTYHAAEEFEVDVAKACHHGAEDIHMEFIKAMHARATVISSGDNEGHSHPRPVAMGASAAYGRECLDSQAKGKVVLPPLLYSTELARSVKLAKVAGLRIPDPDEDTGERPVSPADAMVLAAEHEAKFEPLSTNGLYTDLIYGLVNIRTDGTDILCATKEEVGEDFEVKVFKADVPPEP